MRAKYSPEEIRAWRIGRKASPKTRAKLSAMRRGKPRPDLRGRKASPETRAKMSAARRGKPRPELRGRRWTPEQRAKLKGRVPWNKGKHGIYSPETVAKLSAARRGRPGTPHS